MVNRRMTPAQVVMLVRRIARRHGLKVEDARARGKGSHRMYALVKSDGTYVGTFILPDHPRDLSWGVLRGVEDRLAPLFGERWMEKR